MNEKIKLVEAIKEATKQFNEWRDKLNKLEKQYKQYEIQDLRDKYNNTFWVYKNNCYSIPQNEEDYWNVYYHVEEVDQDSYIEVLKISIDKDNMLEIKQEKIWGELFKNAEFEQTNQEEFQKMWNKIEEIIDHDF
jgi:hypothetical protein